MKEIITLLIYIKILTSKAIFAEMLSLLDLLLNLDYCPIFLIRKMLDYSLNTFYGPKTINIGILDYAKRRICTISVGFTAQNPSSNMSYHSTILDKVSVVRNTSDSLVSLAFSFGVLWIIMQEKKKLLSPWVWDVIVTPPDYMMDSPGACSSNCLPNTKVEHCCSSPTSSSVYKR